MDAERQTAGAAPDSQEALIAALPRLGIPPGGIEIHVGKYSPRPMLVAHPYFVVQPVLQAIGGLARREERLEALSRARRWTNAACFPPGLPTAHSMVVRDLWQGVCMMLDGAFEVVVATRERR